MVPEASDDPQQDLETLLAPMSGGKRPQGEPEELFLALQGAVERLQKVKSVEIELGLQEGVWKTSSEVSL